MAGPICGGAQRFLSLHLPWACLGPWGLPPAPGCRVSPGGHPVWLGQDGRPHANHLGELLSADRTMRQQYCSAPNFGGGSFIATSTIPWGPRRRVSVKLLALRAASLGDLTLSVLEFPRSLRIPRNHVSSYVHRISSSAGLCDLPRGRTVEVPSGVPSCPSTG